MDKYELRILILSSVTMALFIVAILRGVVKYDAGVPECIPYDESFTEPRIEKLDDNLYQIFALAQMWSFEPSEIFLPVGAEVDIYLTSKDVVHGYHINDVSLNMIAPPPAAHHHPLQPHPPAAYTPLRP